MTYRDIQVLAKANKITANQTKLRIITELIRTLYPKSSAKSSTSSSVKNKVTLDSRFPSEIVEKILLEKKNILLKMIELLKQDKPSRNGKLWFNYNNANILDNANISQFFIKKEIIREIKSIYIYSINKP